MGIHQLTDLLLFASCGLFVTTLGFATAWIRSRERLLRFRAEVAGMRDTAPSERVDQAVEAIALEVERIGEQQRFLTKILTQNTTALGAHQSSPRSNSDAVAPRVITPH